MKLEKGTIVKVKGLPFELLADVEVFGNEENYKMSFSQELQSLLKPIQAADLPSKTTSSLSFSSI